MTTLSQRIASLQTERGQMVRAFETTLQPSLDENRDLTEVETTAIDEARTRLDTIDQSASCHDRGGDGPRSLRATDRGRGPRQPARLDTSARHRADAEDRP